MADVYVLRGASPATVEEPFKRKVTRLQSEVWGGLSRVPTTGVIVGQVLTARDFDTSDTLTVVPLQQNRITAKVKLPSFPALPEPEPELDDKLQAIRNAIVHSSEQTELRMALQACMTDLNESFSKLAEVMAQTRDDDQVRFRIWLDEPESAASVRVLSHELAHAFLANIVEEDDWTDAKNDRRCDLVDKKIDGTLTPPEAMELNLLQKQMLHFRRKVAPLPIEEARELHQALLKKARKRGREE